MKFENPFKDDRPHREKYDEMKEKVEENSGERYEAYIRTYSESPDVKKAADEKAIRRINRRDNKLKKLHEDGHAEALAIVEQYEALRTRADEALIALDNFERDELNLDTAEPSEDEPNS